MKYLLLLICICFIFCESNTKKIFDVDAKVLSINTNILNGELIGSLLSSPSGNISNDNIKIGVSFSIDGEIYLEDLEVQHSELAYYKDKEYIPLTLKFYNKEYYYIYIHNRQVKCVINY